MSIPCRPTPRFFSPARPRRRGIAIGTRLLLAAAIASMAACTYHGSGIDNPLTRKPLWFSFAHGDDIRAACQPGTPDRLRAIYNGQWRRQVRVYELGVTAPGRLDIRVIGAPSLASFSLDAPLTPWRGKTASVAVGARDQAALIEAFAQAGAFAPAPETMRLSSDEYYWIVAACHAGRFTLNAWEYPSARFAALTFPAPLLALDSTGVAFAPPRPPGIQGGEATLQPPIPPWQMQVDAGD